MFAFLPTRVTTSSASDWLASLSASFEKAAASSFFLCFCSHKRGVMEPQSRDVPGKPPSSCCRIERQRGARSSLSFVEGRRGRARSDPTKGGEDGGVTAKRADTQIAPGLSAAEVRRWLAALQEAPVPTDGQTPGMIELFFGTGDVPPTLIPQLSPPPPRATAIHRGCRER